MNLTPAAIKTLIEAECSYLNIPPLVCKWVKEPLIVDGQVCDAVFDPQSYTITYTDSGANAETISHEIGHYALYLLKAVVSLEELVCDNFAEGILHGLKNSK